MYVQAVTDCTNPSADSREVPPEDVEMVYALLSLTHKNLIDIISEAVAARPPRGVPTEADELVNDTISGEMDSLRRSIDLEGMTAKKRIGVVGALLSKFVNAVESEPTVRVCMIGSGLVLGE